jgi:hypothetical protein
MSMRNRTEQIIFRASKEEKDRLKKKAANDGKTLSEFIRHLTLGKDRQDEKELPDDWRAQVGLAVDMSALEGFFMLPEPGWELAPRRHGVWRPIGVTPAGSFLMMRWLVPESPMPDG